MKRKAALTAAILVLTMIFAQCAFAAGGLEITGTVPSKGEKGKQLANMAVKIIFNEDVSSAANDQFNAGCITITDPEGAKQEFEIAHHPKYPNEIWCILKGDLVTNTEYTVNVTAGIKATSGNTLASPYSFTFMTRNTKIDSTISIIMTIGMMAIMMFATTRAQSKQQEEKTVKGKGASAPEKLAQADPYRYAKEKGISVQEAKEQIAKEKEKLERKNAAGAKARAKHDAQEAEREAEIQKRLQEIHDASVYKVKTVGSLAKHGGTIPKAVLKKQAARRKARKR